MSIRTITRFVSADLDVPSLIIGSMVKEWPGFITPTALFSAGDTHTTQMSHQEL